MTTPKIEELMADLEQSRQKFYALLQQREVLLKEFNHEVKARSAMLRDRYRVLRHVNRVLDR